MIIKNINILLQDLSKYHRSSADAFYDAVAKRLDKSLDAYNSDLDDSFNYLQRRKPDKLMRKLNK